MALTLFGRKRSTDREAATIRHLKEELRLARISQPVAFTGESFVGFGDSSNARTVFDALRNTAESANRVIRNRIQGLELGVYVRRFVSGDFEDQPAFNHPLQRLLDRPTFNERTGMGTHSGAQLWGASVTQLNSVGEVYLLVIHDGNGVPTMLQLAQPGTLNPVVRNGQIVGYELTSQQASQRMLKPTDLVRIWDPDPFELYTSRGVMVRNATAINMDSHVLQHWQKFYENDATPKLAFESDGQGEFPTDTEQENVAISWAQRFNRRFGRSKLAPYWTLPGWKLKVLDSQGDATSGVAMLKQSSEQVMESYGVSPVMLGRNQDVNRAAAETARFTFDQNTVEPITRMIADALTTQLAAQYDQPTEDVRLIVKYKPFIARDKEFDLRQETADLLSKVRTIDEVRAAREPAEPTSSWGALPVGSFSDVPYTGEEPVIDLTGFGLEEPEETELPPEVDEETEATEEEETRTRELPIMRQLRAHFQPKEEWARQMGRERKWTPRFRTVQRAVLQRQMIITLERWAELGDRMRHQRATPTEIGEELFPIDGWQDMFRRVVDPIRVGAFVESANAATTAITTQTFVLTEAARKAVELQNLSHYVFTNRTTQADVIAALDAGLAGGESVQQVAARIASAFQGRKKDATRIARTEMAAAVSEAQVQGFEQTGVVERKQWNSSLDAAVRDSHLIDGQTVALDADFTLGDGDSGAAPADPRMDVSNRVNCRCFVTPVFFDEDAAGLGFPVGAEGAL